MGEDFHRLPIVASGEPSPGDEATFVRTTTFIMATVDPRATSTASAPPATQRTSRRWSLLMHMASGFTRCVYWIYSLQPKDNPYLLAPIVGWFIRTPVYFGIRKKMRLIWGNQPNARERWRAFWPAHRRHVGLNVLEPEPLAHTPPEIIHQIMTIRGEEHLRTAVAQGRGVMLFINHCGPSSVGPLLARFGYDLTFAGDAMLVPHLEEWLQGIFRQVGAHRVLLGDDLPQRVAEVFKRNGIFATFTDLTTWPKHTVWLPLGAAEICVPYGPAVLALRHRVPVLYLESIRLPGNRYEAVIHPVPVPTEGSLTERAQALMGEATKLLERAVNKNAEQWWALDYVKLREPQPNQSIDH